MTNIRIQNLSLRQFKGAAQFALTPSGENLAIHGSNAAGKSTIADAYFWCLTGKDSRGRADFEIKTIVDGKPMKKGEHEVVLTLAVDGKPTEFSRTFKERWQTERGRATAEYKGNTTVYKVNGVPVDEREYVAQVAALLDAKTWRLLSDPAAFNSLKWDERRQLLLDICGNIAMEDVIAANANLKELPAILGDKTPAELAKINGERAKKIREELQTIPARIDELNRAKASIPKPTGVDVAALRAQLSETQEIEVRIRAGGETAELRSQIADRRAALVTLEAQERAIGSTATDELRAALRSAEDQLARTVDEENRLAAKLAAEQRALAQHEAQFETAKAEGLALRQAVPTATPDMTTCPGCGQELPAEKIEAALARARDTHAKRVEEDAARGRQIRDRIAAAKESITEIEASQRGSAAVRVDQEERVTKLEAELAAKSEATAAPREPHPDIARLTGEIAALNTRIEELATGNTKALAELATKKADITARIAEEDKIAAAIAQADRDAERVAELTARETELSAELERIEQAKFLLEEFTREKMTLLTSRINDKFRIARWRLFEPQVNGGVSETCICEVDGVGYHDLNTGMRLNVGLDIINVLAEHVGVATPILIDNAESVTEILPTHGQQIQLIVSAADRELRVTAPTSGAKQTALAV